MVTDSMALTMSEVTHLSQSCAMQSKDWLRRPECPQVLVEAKRRRQTGVLACSAWCAFPTGASVLLLTVSGVFICTMYNGIYSSGYCS